MKKLIKNFKNNKKNLTKKIFVKKRFEGQKIVGIISWLLNLINKKTRKTFLIIINNLLNSYRNQGVITFEEQQLFVKLATLSEKKIGTLMTSRNDIIAVSANENINNIKKNIVEKGHSRIPVFKENIDEIIGFIHSKDLIQFLSVDVKDFKISKILRKILFVPATIKPIDLLLKMRIARTHMAVVLDEFGAVDGLITIENIMEEIVGNIDDEHDLPSDNSFFRIKKKSEDSFEFGARVAITKIEEIFDIKLSNLEDNFETIGGFALAVFKKIPETGEELEFKNLKIKIIEGNKRVLKIISIDKIN
jgi:magnesium and cobalt transporter